MGKACKALSISRSTAYEWRNADPEFAAAWDRAMRVGLSALEDEAHRRAFDGTEEPVFHAGEQCGTVRKYSDTLAIFLLKAHDPQRYRENSTTPANVEIQAAIAVLMKQLAQGLPG